MLSNRIVRDNLDALFKEAKQKKDVNDEKREKEAKKKAKKEEQMKKMEFEAINEMKAVNGGINDTEAHYSVDPIRIDKETGLKVYREDQLNLGKGGNTPLCPFDCDCCF